MGRTLSLICLVSSLCLTGCGRLDEFRSVGTIGGNEASVAANNPTTQVAPNESARAIYRDLIAIAEASYAEIEANANPLAAASASSCVGGGLQAGSNTHCSSYGYTISSVNAQQTGTVNRRLNHYDPQLLHNPQIYVNVAAVINNQAGRNYIHVMVVPCNGDTNFSYTKELLPPYTISEMEVLKGTPGDGRGNWNLYCP